MRKNRRYSLALACGGVALLALGALSLASPALALENPLDRGPLADFLNVFREQAIPRQVVV